MSTLITKDSKYYNMYIIILNFAAKNILHGSLENFKLYEEYPSGSKEINLTGEISVVKIVNNIRNIRNFRVKINIIIETSLITLTLQENSVYTAYLRTNSIDIYFYTSSPTKPALIIENGK